MFTGIVQTKTAITAINSCGFGLQLEIEASGLQFPDVRTAQIGDSICVSGVCLTISALDKKRAIFDVIKETLDKTTIGNLSVGAIVNLEPAVTANQPLGGHFMQGHVDSVGKIVNIKRVQEETRFTIQPPTSLMDYIIPKGSVALDGVSLTIASLQDNTLDVALIPTTLEVTTLGQKQIGDNINIEADILTKTTVHLLKRQNQMDNQSALILSKDVLVDSGFV